MTRTEQSIKDATSGEELDGIKQEIEGRAGMTPKNRERALNLIAVRRTQVNRSRPADKKVKISKSGLRKPVIG
jgi:hypothetical protein